MIRPRTFAQVVGSASMRHGSDPLTQIETDVMAVREKAMSIAMDAGWRDYGMSRTCQEIRGKVFKETWQTLISEYADTHINLRMLNDNIASGRVELTKENEHVYFA